MKDIIEDSFTGILNLSNSETSNAFFSINGNLVTLLPLSEECGKAIDRLSGMDGKGPADDSKQWFYGFADDNTNVAILRNSRMRCRLTSGYNMKAAQFRTPLIVKSTAAGTNIDLSTFDTIEFYGGIVDILHNPDRAICHKENTISLVSPDNYTERYDVDINGEHFEVEYSISTTGLCLELGKLPDLRNTVHSVLRFNFRLPVRLEDIEKYYSYAMSLFQFCSGRLNVCSDVRIYKNNVGGRPILLRLKDGFDDYADDLDITKVIRFSCLGEHLPNLLKLLNEKGKAPYLNFLPKRNKDINNILYTDVNDICIAFEIEYSHTERYTSREEKKAAKELAETLIGIVDNKEDCPDVVRNKAKAILNTQLKGYVPPLKEKIAYICKLYYEPVKSITEPPGHDALGITKFYSSEEFEKKITKFVDIRNSASHARIDWNDGVKIFYHLKLYIYFSILVRSGIAPEITANILSWMYGWLF